MVQYFDFWSGLLGRFPSHNVPFLSAADKSDKKKINNIRSAALVLAYDGIFFGGWQIQPNISTIQGELERVLSKLCSHPVRVCGSGRTDAGVHALGQVASFKIMTDLTIKKILTALRILLPSQIYPRELGEVPLDFHARYSAKIKTYDYYLWPQAGPTLFLHRKFWSLMRVLSESKVYETLELLPGLRDLRTFTSRSAKVYGSTLRRIYEAKLDIDIYGLWRIRVTANGFLRHIVRNLVGALVQVGYGQLQPDEIWEAFEIGKQLKGGLKAPAYGLYLNRVYY